MLGSDIIDFFQAFGPFWLIVGFAVISFLDGFAIPTLPEAWLLLIALTPTPVPLLAWGVILVFVGVGASVGAQYSLFSIVRRLGMPKRVKRVMNKYIQILVVSSEKLAFMNWLTPVVPFTGAFIAVSDWKPKLAFMYSTAGGFVKIGILVAVAIIFPQFFRPQDVADASLILVLVVLALSLLITFIRHQKIQRQLQGTEKLDQAK